MQNTLISIGKTAKILGVSIDTLRRWDLAGRLPSIRSGPHGHRYYNQSDIDEYLKEIETVARNWVEEQNPIEPKADVYCPTRDVFQARLERLQSRLGSIGSLNTVSLITAVAGEIGNNSFDHNLGNWPDISGIYFAYSVRNRKVVLADRGQGILATLQRVRAELTNSEDAMRVAFTETLSGRYPENRGNGLKFVRSVLVENHFSLYFQTGDAELRLKHGDTGVLIQKAKSVIRGCFAVISFEGAL